MIPPLLALPGAVLGTVAIDVPSDMSRTAADRIVESCQAVLGEGQCALVLDGGGAEWRATIALDGVRLVVTLEHAGPRRLEVARREVAFSEGDNEEQRSFAAGLIVAALTAQQPKESRPAESAHPAGDTAARDTSAPERESAPFGAVDVGGLVGRGITTAHPKLGAVARGSVLLDRLPIDITASVHFATALGDTPVRWWGGSAGIGTRLMDRSSPLSLELRGEVLLEQADARATRNGLEQRVTSSWRGGGRVGSIVSYRLAHWIVPWVAAELSVVRPELVVRVADSAVGSEGDVRWAFSLGGRFYIGE